jgi:hypothetical protein
MSVINDDIYMVYPPSVDISQYLYIIIHMWLNMAESSTVYFSINKRKIKVFKFDYVYSFSI